MSVDEESAASRDTDDPTQDAGEQAIGGHRALARGASIGRYLILDKLGEGGVGIVFGAYDPQLDRRVALKLMRGDPHAARRSPARRERVLHEARALARVVHPNIVGVHDAGYHEDELFLVMEFVDGTTLGNWLRQRGRSQREILDVFSQAGRGLAAAHSAGLVHRDFKPDNVLVGKDRRVRVADFGLARVLDAAIEDSGGETRAEVGGLTHTGAVVGTPAYMAPEQFAGERVSARTDQFAFCVTLFEALYRTRPFAGATYEALSANVRAGNLVSVPGRQVPAWLRNVVARGLAVDPARRFPSFAELLAELGRDPAATRRRVFLLIGLVAVVVAAGLAVVTGRRSPPDVCAAAATDLGAVWNNEVRAEVERALLATNRSYAGGTVAYATGRLDAYAAEWTAMRVEACQATHLRGTQSAATLDLRMRCLDNRLGELRAAAAVLTRADEQVLKHAANVVAGMEPVAACADVDALSAVVPPPGKPLARARLQVLRGLLTAAAATHRAGAYRQALALVEPALADARLLGYGPLLAEALYRRGWVQQKLGDAAACEASFREAAAIAAAAHDDTTFARSMVALAGRIGTAHRFEEERIIRPFVEAALARAPADDDLRVRWLTTLGLLHQRAGKFAEGRRYHEEALAIRERLSGPDSWETALVIRNLATAQRDLAEYAESLQTFERAAVVTEKALGPEHPEHAEILHWTSYVLRKLNRVDEAEAMLIRALGLRERALGPDHPEVGATLQYLAAVLQRKGEHARALALSRRALAISEAAYGKEHPEVGRALQNLANSLVAVGKLEEAEIVQLRRVAISEKVLGRDHPYTADTLAELAAIYRRRGQPERALPLAERAIAIIAASPETDRTAEILVIEGSTLVALGRHAEARPRFARALAIDERILGAHHVDLAPALLGLAETTAKLEGAARAVPLLERAVALRKNGAAAPELVADAELALAKALQESRQRAHRR